MSRPIVNNGSLDVRDDLTVADMLTVNGVATLNTLHSSGATITGGTVDGTAIGASVPASVAATTLTAAGSTQLATLTASGSVNLNGSTVNFNTDFVNIGNDTNGAAPASDTGHDRGLLFHWHDGANPKTGFFGFDRSQQKFVFVPDATVTAGAVSGTAVSVVNPSDINSAIGYTPANLAGDTFTGPVILAADPTNALGAATKQYVDTKTATRQASSADLSSIAGLASTAGFLKKIASGSWAIDTNTYLTGNQSISVTGDAAGSGTTSINLTLSNTGVGSGTYGSTSQIPVLTVDAKGRVSNVVNTNISIAASQVSSGTFADSQISQSSVTQFQSALSLQETQIQNGSVLARVADNEVITGTWSFNNPVTGVLPTQSGHLATKKYVDDSITGLDVKNSVRAATTGPLPPCTAAGAGVGKTLTANSNGALGIDGVTVVSGDRILVKNESNAANNGIYTVTATGSVSTAFVLTRAQDADGSPSSEITSGMYTLVSEGSSNATSGWILNAADPLVVDTSALTFTQFTGLGQITAGNGLTQTGNTFDVAVADVSRLVVTANAIDLAVSGVTAGSYNGITVDAYGRIVSITSSSSNVISQLGYTPVNKAGDTMTGALALPANGLTVGTNQLIATGGFVDIGVSAPVTTLHIATSEIIERVGGSSPHLVLRGQNGALGTPATTTASNGIGKVSGNGYNGTSFNSSGEVEFLASENYQSSAFGAHIIFRSVLTGSNALTERARFEAGSGALLIGTQSSRSVGGIVRPLQVETLAQASASFVRNTADNSGSAIVLAKTRSTTLGGSASVAANDELGVLSFTGADGTTVNTAAALIQGLVDGTPGTNIVPGRLVFSTANSSGNMTEAFRVDSRGNFGLGTTGLSRKFQVMAANATTYVSTSSTLATPADIVSIQTSTNAAGTSALQSMYTTYGGATRYFGLVADGGYSGHFVIGRRTGSTAYTEDFRIDNNGNVGVNKVSPAAKFNIAGGNILIDGATWGVQFNDTNQYISTDSAGTALAFGTGAAERMRISAVGNVGVGTSAPATLLHVYTPSASGVSPAIRISKAGQTSGFDIGIDSTTSDAFIINRENANLLFRTNNTERLRIDSSGNVGVGTTSASSRLTVLGSVRTLTGGTVILNNPTDSAAAELAFISGDHLVFRGAGSAERLRIDATGNVGVGTNNPLYTLDVAGTVRSSAGGFRFPDGTLQTTAATGTASSLTLTQGAIVSGNLSTSSTSQAVVDTFSVASFQSARYQIQISSGGSFQVTNVQVLHDGTNAFILEYGNVVTSTSLAIFDADISAGNLRLLVTPVNAATVVKFIRSAINV
jgi:hypothetical protein